MQRRRGGGVTAAAVGRNVSELLQRRADSTNPSHSFVAMRLLRRELGSKVRCGQYENAVRYWSVEWWTLDETLCWKWCHGISVLASHSIS